MAAAAPRFSALLSMFPLLLCVFCTFGLHSTAALDTNLPEGEVEALRKINAKLKIGWDFSVDPCSRQRGWLGSIDLNVTCDCNVTANICHVVLINLKSQNLTGVLPEEFGNLTKLYYLDLTRNYINGTIPAAAWASLPLIHLGLSGNRISGRIPKEIRNISTLQELVLENNLLRGRLPRALGSLKNLTQLILSGNYFSEEIPDSLANLKSLTDFRIDGTNISGRIPAFIGNWTQLVNLYLQGTSLEGPFPPTFSKLKNIVLLRVSDMKSDGVFPNLNETLKLKELILRNCSLSGEIPTYLWSMPELKILDLSFNHLTGKLPDVQVLRKLDNMYLTNNMLSGTIPEWIVRSKNKIDLSYNNFTGQFPPNHCQSGNLNLVASYSYSVKNTINSCSECSGKPNHDMFINCGGNKVDVEGHEYEEDTWGSGDASALFHISQSKKWALSSTGNFFDNSKAKYIATIPMLNMSYSGLYLEARLSPSSLKYYGLCLQKGNYTVKLHFAEIEFTSDQTFSSLGRRLFDISIQGQNVLKEFNIAVEANGTRKEIIKTFVASVEDAILEIHFQWAGKGTTSIPSKGVYGPLISAISVTPNFTPDYGEHRRLSVGSILGIVAASTVVILLALLFLWFCIRKKYQDNDELKRKLQASYFSLSQIKSATGNFDPANKIGEGGFGPVFKGLLPDGSLIAVKQLSSKSRQGNREFVNEIGMISALQHPNLVKLLGCCIEGNQLLLIYEFMENNSLARALFGPQEMTLNLDWQTRCKICLDIARGLAYLHEESRLKIVHRDIKATNILLDKDLNAKISDFGLAKLDDEEKSHITTRIAGTKGYMAPEYAMRGRLTDKADVYSFGVVMLEIISGKANTNYQPEEKFTNLLDRVYVLKEQGTVLDLVDPRLGANYSKEEAQRMLNLALTCTSTSPTQRPTMSTVVSMLEGGVPAEVPTVQPSEGNDTAQISPHEIQEDMSIEAPMTDSSTTLSNIKEESTALNPSSRSV